MQLFAQFFAGVTQDNDYFQSENNEYDVLNPESINNVAASGMMVRERLAVVKIKRHFYDVLDRMTWI